jgi:hypothetical protein
MVPAGELKVDFREGDSRLDVAKNADGTLAGTLRGEPVICLPVSTNQMESRIGPRHVMIYSKISADTLVHPFRGIAERERRPWAVMKDLRQAKSLALSLQNAEFQEIKDKLVIAFELAKTVAYLHSVEILIKNLTDRDVLLTKSEDRWKPILTNLEKARYVSQRNTFSPLTAD